MDDQARRSLTQSGEEHTMAERSVLNIPAETRRKMDEIKANTGATFTAQVIQAIDALYADTLGPGPEAICIGSIRLDDVPPAACLHCGEITYAISLAVWRIGTAIKLTGPLCDPCLANALLEE